MAGESTRQLFVEGLKAYRASLLEQVGRHVTLAQLQTSPDVCSAEEDILAILVNSIRRIDSCIAFDSNDLDSNDLAFRVAQKAHEKQKRDENAVESVETLRKFTRRRR